MNINQKIKEKICRARLKPKWQFLTCQIFIDVILIVAWILSVFVIGIIIYLLSHYNPWASLPKGFFYFLQACKDLPWELILVLLFLVVAIYFTSRKSYFIYRLNSLVILAIIVASLAIGYYVAEKMGLHENISQAPIAKQIYTRQGKVFLVSRGVVIIGEIKGAKNNHMIIADDDKKQWEISFDKKTIFITGKNFNINEIIKINGIRKEANHIQALTVQKLDASWRGFFDKFRNRNLIPCDNCAVY